MIDERYNIIPGFCDKGLSMTRSGELLPSLGMRGSINKHLRKAAYLGAESNMKQN